MKQMQLRISILRLVAALIVAVLLYNLFQIQVIEGEEWADIADNNRFRHLVQRAPRGRIFTADGVELASNIPCYEVALAFEQDPAKRQQAIDVLADLLGMEAEEIQNRLKKNHRRFEPTVVARNVDFATVALLEENKHRIPGLVVQINPQRVYPQKTLLAHVLGRLIDGKGVEGLERQWEDYLRGENGFSVIQVNAANSPVGEPVNSKPAVPGKDLHLTVDAGLQQVAQESLHRVLRKLREERKLEDAWTGAVVVIDPNSGRILAMASEPSFDNNVKYNYAWPDELPQKDTVRTYRDRVLNWRKPVGSTFKMITGLAALETGHVTATEKIRDTGSARISGQMVRNYGSAAYGYIDLPRALEVSSNIYFGTLGSRMGHELIYEYIDKFGMSGTASGESREGVMKNAGFTDIALDEQMYSLDYYRQMMKHGGSFYPGHTVQMSYGQLNEFTVMQMANYVSMLANGGIHYKPYLVEKITAADGEVVEFFEPVILAQHEFDPKALDVVRKGMRLAASGGQFRNLPFAVAGKTGTSEEAGKENHAWWVGYAPYDNPEIAIVVFLEHGGLGLRAAEVARDIIDYYFGLK
ncbi:MAG TPA: penicillin-binding transpeptidase domain-containing protein [Bacillota bacterium]|nr:penicillin-binding transpeptidase domain-containing protein [Bacillota bacterium]HPZ90585.1 penicillin-binding transpeptidase domain-containing protein [Bacillota bacterium]HQE02203.1 penicillin-binding transpeptidase domain-containing protein [Bacillota bacterium]